MLNKSLDPRRLQYFLAVVDHGGAGRGARALGVSQPAVSDGLARLETDLGALLFHRIGRDLVLSDAGRDLLPAARRALSSLELARQSVMCRPGSTTIAVTAELSLHPLASLLVPLLAQRPGTAVHLIPADSSPAVVGAVQDGHAELGLTHHTPTQFELLEHDLEPIELGVAVSADDPLAKAGTTCTDGVPGRVLPRQLHGRALVLGPPGTSAEVALEMFRAGGAHPRVVVRGAPMPLLPVLVGRGVGAALLPRTMETEVRSCGGALLSLDPPVLLSVQLVHREGELSPTSQALADLARCSHGEAKGAADTGTDALLSR